LLEQLKQVLSDDEEEDIEDKENVIGEEDDEELFETDPEEEDENGNHVQNNKHTNESDLKAKNKAIKNDEPMEFT
jgi:hypothetical protein